MSVMESPDIKLNYHIYQYDSQSVCGQATSPGYQSFSKQYLLRLLIYCLNLIDAKMPSNGTFNTPNISQVEFESNFWNIIMLF